MSDIDELARICYEAGVAPLDYSESCITTAMGAGEILRSTREETACRILGALLDAGWQMPVWPIPEPAQEAS